MPHSTNTPFEKLSIFHWSCWSLAAVAFCQFLVAAVALANRFERSRQICYVDKEVIKHVAVPVPSSNSPSSPTTSTPTLPPIASSQPAPTRLAEPGVISKPPPTPTVAPTPLNIPKVSDPAAERLVDEARRARVAGDMARSVMQLEEALTRAPNDPVVIFELGVIHEQLGVNDKASAYYEKVFQLGTDAGSLYEIAATKLREGFQSEEMLGKLSLSRVRIFNDPNQDDHQRVILTIPIQKAPSESIDVNELSVDVAFFNRNDRNEIVQLEDESWVTQQWISLPFDWINNEEQLRMIYQIPKRDTQTDHLFGKLSYYGQVVTLKYKGEVMDVQAWPRDLAARIAQPAPPSKKNDPSPPEFQQQLPADFNPDMPLLPPLPE